MGEDLASRTPTTRERVPVNVQEGVLRVRMPPPKQGAGIGASAASLGGRCGAVKRINFELKSELLSWNRRSFGHCTVPIPEESGVGLVFWSRPPPPAPLLRLCAKITAATKPELHLVVLSIRWHQKYSPETCRGRIR